MVDRWDYLSLHDPAHAAAGAYALNPHLHSVDCMMDESVKQDLEQVVAEFYQEVDDQVKCLVEFHHYKTKGIPAWKSPFIWMQAKYLSPCAFWKMHGACAPLLRPLAVVIHELNHAAGLLRACWL